MSDTQQSAGPEQVFAAVHEAIRKQFGASAEIQQVGSTQQHVAYEFTVDEVSYLLTVHHSG